MKYKNSINYHNHYHTIQISSDSCKKWLRQGGNTNEAWFIVAITT